MKRNEENFHKPSRQPLIAIAVLLFDSFKNVIRQLWPLLLLALFNRKGGSNFFLVFGGIGIGIFSFVISLLRYYRFQYFIQDDELVIEKGIVTQSKVNVPFRRVQSINFEQNVFHRALGLVSFRIETAGSDKAELEIPAIYASTADQLREFIVSKRSNLSAEQGKEIVHTQDTYEEIFYLGIPDLLRVGVSVNHLKTAGIIIALVWGLYTQAGEVFREYSLEWLIETFVFKANLQWLFYLLILFPFFLVIAFIASLVVTVIRFFGLKVFRFSDGLKVVAGLFNRKEQTAIRPKMQTLSWITNPIRALFGMYNARIKQAASVEINSRQSVVVPGCRETDIDNLQTFFFRASLDDPYQEFRIHPAIISRYTVYFGVVPVLIIIGYAILTQNYLLYSSILWIPIAFFLFRIYHRKWKIRVNKDLLMAEKGIIGNHYELMYTYKIQSVSLRQTPYQFRKDLANLSIYTAAGDIHIPYLPLDTAHYLRDFLLYKAERTSKSWM